jgi:citrate synthase
MTKDFFEHLTNLATKNNHIPAIDYDRYNIKRGLRNANGTGVLVGLTEIGNVDGYDIVNKVKVPKEGRLFYRGIDVFDRVDGFQTENRRGFEETAFLLLFGKLPTMEELDLFNTILDEHRDLPAGFTDSMIVGIPAKNVMNKLQRSTLVLYSYDDNPDDLSMRNLVDQSLNLIAKFPTMISYGYQSKARAFDGKSLFIHPPKKNAGTAENILHMTRADNKYSDLEAETLDLLLVIMAEHGGGNNSTFATHVVASTGTDTYSAVATAVGSLKGPKHGGANQKVRQMVETIKAEVEDWTDRAQLADYLERMLNKEVYDKKGLIYGMGHAVYTKSDPRSVLLQRKAKQLSIENGFEKEYQLYENIESITRALFYKRKGPHAHIASNVDLYSGFVLEMLDIPEDLYTPIFATSRIAGWCAHRLEQLVSDEKIIRPAYKTVNELHDYSPLKERA